MVAEELGDGPRIAQLLASELTGHEDGLARFRVVDVDEDVSPTVDGALAYRVAVTGDEGGKSDGHDTAEAVEGDETDTGERIAAVNVQPERAHVAFRVAPEIAAEAADAAGLRVRPKAVRPPRTLVFLENGAQVKWILPVFEAVLAEYHEPT